MTPDSTEGAGPPPLAGSFAHTPGILFTPDEALAQTLCHAAWHAQGDTAWRDAASSFHRLPDGHTTFSLDPNMRDEWMRVVAVVRTREAKLVEALRFVADMRFGDYSKASDAAHAVQQRACDALHDFGVLPR